MRSNCPATRRLGGCVETNKEKGPAMFFLRIIPTPDAGLDSVQICDETFRLLLEIDGRKPAVGWLVDQGCCPGAAAMLHDCAYGQIYNINGAAVPADAGSPA